MMQSSAWPTTRYPIRQLQPAPLSSLFKLFLLNKIDREIRKKHFFEEKSCKVKEFLKVFSNGKFAFINQTALSTISESENCSNFVFYLETIVNTTSWNILL